MDIRQQAIREKAIRELDKRNKPIQEDLLEFMKYVYKNENPKGIQELLVDDYMYILSDALMKVIEKKTNRLIINIPPGHTKTEFVSKFLPLWALWNNPYMQVITTWYSTKLTQGFSQETKEVYESPSYKRIFPRSAKLSATQNTKEHWKTEDGGSYYSTWCGGTITGKRTNLFIIDDPIKPDEADKSEVVRSWINNWYKNTVISRLFNPMEDAIIIIMQRTHQDDLCWHLVEEMEDGSWEKFTTINLPAIAVEDEAFETRYGMITRKEWESLAPKRFWLDVLALIKESVWKVNFSCQYQQNPVDKESQEFHEEWFRYEDNMPSMGRVFTTVDPAFTKNKNSDDSAIVTGMFIDDKMYILEYTAGKYDVWELIDKMIYHINKRNPEKIGIEAFQAQVTIAFWLRAELTKRGMHCPVEEIRQQWDKESKIRRLLPLYRNGLIYHKRDMDLLEKQLTEFPRGKHDDVIDAVQMLYDMYTLQPNTHKTFDKPVIKYWANGRPIVT